MIFFSLVLGIIFTLASLARYERIDVPDLAATRHGFPLVWLSHQTMSIAGPTDIWYFEWTNLILDFAFWYLISTLLVYVWRKFKVTSQ
jgi:hypothetical protein